MEDLRIAEFRHKILLRLLFNKMSTERLERGVLYEELLPNIVFCTNEVLRESGMDQVAARRRGKRVFLFHSTFHKIVCEIGVIPDKTTTRLCHVPDIAFINLHGKVPEHFMLGRMIYLAGQKAINNSRRTYHA